MDFSRVEHLEARKLLKAHYDDDGDDDARRAATAELRARRDAASELVWQKHRELEKELLAPIEAEIEAIEKPFEEREQKRWTDLEAKLKELGVEFEEFKLHDDYCGVHCCEISGLPLMEGDELGTTPSGDEFIFSLLVPA